MKAFPSKFLGSKSFASISYSKYAYCRSMSLKRVSYTDSDGRKRVVLLPEEYSDDQAEAIGIPVGPPRLDELGLPLELEVRLNNELFHRGILEPNDALRRRPDIMGAIQSALKIDTDAIVTLYVGKDFKNASTKSSSEETKVNQDVKQPAVRRQTPRSRRRQNAK